MEYPFIAMDMSEAFTIIPCSLQTRFAESSVDSLITLPQLAPDTPYTGIELLTCVSVSTIVRQLPRVSASRVSRMNLNFRFHL
jgi:hypothetical protein